MRKIAVSEIVLDFEIYPRHQIDAVNVANLIRAMEAGVQLPPIVICKRTKRPADGFHRVRGYMKFFGPDYKVDVIEKNYKSDNELFLDAVRLNSSHGKNLTSYDHARCVAIASRLQIDPPAMADALHMTDARYGNIITERLPAGEKIQSTAVLLKRTNRHLANHEITERQEQGNRKAGGMNQLFYVEQVINLIENDLLDTENERLMQRLADLAERLSGVLAVA